MIHAPEEFKIEAQAIQCDSDEQWEIGEEFNHHLLTVINKFSYL